MTEDWSAAASEDESVGSEQIAESGHSVEVNSGATAKRASLGVALDVGQDFAGAFEPYVG